MHVIYNQGSPHKYIKSGEHYLVYAIQLGSSLKYCIQLDAFPSAPSFYDATLFTVSDSRISHHWILHQKGKLPASLAFSAWAQDDYFYQNLVNSEGEAGEIWRSYRSKMELEFAPPDLQVTSTSLPEDWHTCCSCEQVWQPENYGEVIVCPKCSTVQRRGSETLGRHTKGSESV